MWKKSKSEEKNANAHLFKGGLFVAKNNHITADKKDQTVKYDVLIAFKGQMSSNISNLFIFKSKVHFPYIYEVWCAFQTQKPAKRPKIGHILDLKRLDLKRTTTFDHIYLF